MDYDHYKLNHNQLATMQKQQKIQKQSQKKLQQIDAQKHTQKQQMLSKQQNVGEEFDKQQQQYSEQELEHEKWKKIAKPDKQIKLYMIDFNQCDSKKCTGRKMQRFALLKSIKEKKKKFKGIVLSAFGEQPVSREDLDICVKSGICVIDCSWNRINETDQFRFKHERILPYVIAGNPVNYGKPYQLSCAEALTTALCSIGYTQQAQYIMSKFGWSDGFWSLNQHVLDYGRCANLEQLKEMSEQKQGSNGMMKQRQYQMPESSQSDQ